MRVWVLIFFTLTLSAFIAMRLHQFKFESEAGTRFNVMDFELPGSTDNLNVLLEEWSSPQKKQFVLKQLFLDYFFMLSLFPCIALINLWNRERIQKIEIFQNKRNQYYPLLKVTFLSIAILQFLALLFDLSENIRLTLWINQGIVNNMHLFENLVRVKFLFAFLGIFSGIVGMIYTTFQLRH
jgi:hypothetical protein